MRNLTIAGAGLVAATGAWTVVMALGFDDHPANATVSMAISLWTATVVSLTGLLVARARWARRYGISVTAGHGVVALLAPVDVGWVVAAVLSAATAVAIAGPWLDGTVRGRPAASGPPPRAVLIPLALIWVPFGVGAASGDGLPALVAGLLALITAYWFIRTLPGALVAVRIVWPLAAVGVAFVLGWAAGAVVALAGVAVAVLAWDDSVRNAVHPLIEKGSRISIPPELAPQEILDAADLDERGRPR
ncbi:MAG TPA: hypothetical protein VHL52_14880 [Acidimicrobiia bacterium]|nr:hypothetical protein [Acidimicrobiia bacterium]